MKRKAFVLTDLNFGDAGKGTTTEFLTRLHKAPWNIRTGGAQAAHNVVLRNGMHHMHSQFAAGTLAGALTFLSENMVMSPYALFAEGNSLWSKHSINDIYERVVIHKRALAITPWHLLTNKIKELARSQRKGTVGIGVGETVRDSWLNEELAIRGQDLLCLETLLQKMTLIQEHKVQQIQDLGIDIPQLSLKAQEHWAMLTDKSIIPKAAQVFYALGKKVSVVDDEFLYTILQNSQVIIIEPSQGVLLDHRYGFTPNTTQLVNTNEDGLAMIRQLHYPGEIIRLGVMRAYQTRHGAGVFVTEDTHWSQALPDFHNSSEHPWQGTFRVGPLDAIATRYALDVCGGPEAFDGMVITNIDRLKSLHEWKIADRYLYCGDQNLELLSSHFVGFENTIEGILVQQDPIKQAQLTSLLTDCIPQYVSLSNLTTPPYERFLQMIQERTQVPNALISYGPTAYDKKGTSWGEKLIS